MLTLKCDDVIEHILTLHKVFYTEHSPVNILCTRRPAELFLDERSNPDTHGRGVTSLSDKHVLFWNQNKHRKSFVTTLSGPPEYLPQHRIFNLHFLHCSRFKKHYNDSISWVHKYTAIGKNKFLREMPLLYLQRRLYLLTMKWFWFIMMEVDPNLW
jgi:hypothetical protein